MRHTKRVAIVTGGARGIGRAIAMAFAASDVATVIADIDIDAAEKTGAEIRALGAEACAIGVDVSQNADIVRLVDDCVGRFGRVDVLVNNAGVLSSTTYDEVTEAEWDRVMAINLKGVMFATREALRPMKAQGFGRVISISSLAGRSGGVRSGAAYVASKAALIGLTRHLARSVARDGITVNAVAPGTTDTDILKGFTAEQMAAINEAIPVGRLGRPEEIAAMVAFLASDAAAFITGAVIDVNGGMYMG
jgi:NAD(P)-dependent dehydrogenase (short-subunit alcohol dehydrogenase family)